MRWPGGRGACLSDARESAPRESDKAYTSNPVLIGHYLNWPECAASTEGGVLHQSVFPFRSNRCSRLQLQLVEMRGAALSFRPSGNKS
jgi:hypothetical protein